MFKLKTPGQYKETRLYQTEKSLKQFGKEAILTSRRLGLNCQLFLYKENKGWIEVKIQDYFNIKEN